MNFLISSKSHLFSELYSGWYGSIKQNMPGFFFNLRSRVFFAIQGGGHFLHAANFPIPTNWTFNSRSPDGTTIRSNSQTLCYYGILRNNKITAHYYPNVGKLASYGYKWNSTIFSDIQYQTIVTKLADHNLAIVERNKMSLGEWLLWLNVCVDFP